MLNPVYLTGSCLDVRHDGRIPTGGSPRQPICPEEMLPEPANQHSDTPTPILFHPITEHPEIQNETRRFAA